MFSASRGCSGLAGHPAKSGVGGCSTAIRRGVRCNARHRRPDYASRRSGSDEENVRRASRGNISSVRASSPDTASARDASWGWGREQNGRSSNSHDSNGGAPIDPRSRQRRSANYASRRSSSDPENNRRRSSSPGPSFFDNPAPTSPSPSPSRNGGPPVDPRVQRRRSIDYVSRRNGSSNGAARRRSATSPSPGPAQDQSSTPSSSPTRSTPHIDPRVLRRRSIDYAARRTGSNSSASQHGTASPSRPSGGPPIDPRARQRRSADYASRRSSSSPSSRPAASPLGESAPQSPAGSPSPYRDPRVRRRGSVDYASRRSSSDGGSARRRSSSSRTPTASTRRAAASRAAPAESPSVHQRHSVDYSGRRGAQDSDASRRFVAPAAAAATGQPPVHRKSADYASRRSGGDEENQRRRSADSREAPREPSAAAPSAASPPRRQSTTRRRSTPDYAARRGGEVTRRRSSVHSRSPPARRGTAPAGVPADARSNNGGGAQPYIARKAIPSYESRRSRDFAQRRRSMRYTMKEVRSALEAHNRRTAGGRISPPPIPGSSVLDVPFVDYGAHALRSIEGLLDTLCEIAKLPADEIKRTPPPRSVLRRDSDDAAKGALRSLSGIASLIVEKAPVSW